MTKSKKYNRTRKFCEARIQSDFNFISDRFNIRSTHNNSLGESFSFYIESLISKHRSINTINSYYYDINGFLKYLKLNYPEIQEPSQVKKIHISKFFIYSKIELQNSGSTINRKNLTLKQFFEFLIEQEIIESSQMPIAKKEVIRTKNSKNKSIPIFLEEYEVKTLFESILEEKNEFQRERNYTIVAFLFYSGLRVSELTNLNIQDLNYIKENQILNIIGKGEKERTIAISQKAFNDGYLTHVDKYLELREKQSITQNDRNALFISREGTRLTSRSIQRMITKYINNSTIEKNITPHKIRHTFGTTLAKKKVSIRVIQSLLGHESLATTQIYTHVLTEEIIEAVEALD